MQSASWKGLKLSSGCPQKLTKVSGNDAIDLDIQLICKCTNCQNESKYLCAYKNQEMEFEVTVTMNNGSILKNDLRKLLFNKEMSDFTFKVDDEEIPVNKAILAARSPVFYKLFNSDLMEKYTDSNSLTSKFSKETFKELIRFIYIEEIENFDKLIFGLLYAAHHYDINSLKERCEDKMLKMIDTDIVIEIFQGAHACGCSDDLKQAAFNRIKKIFKKRNFELPDELMNNPSKVDELFSALEVLEGNICPKIAAD